MIEVNGLVKLYGERKVLHELDFTVKKGQVCGFLGPNGSGKSQLWISLPDSWDQVMVL